MYAPVFIMVAVMVLDRVMALPAKNNILKKIRGM